MTGIGTAHERQWLRVVDEASVPSSIQGNSVTFAERIRWRQKHFWHEEPWHGNQIFKLTARQFAEACNVPVPELYWSGRDPQEIPFERLPPRYVAKGTHGDSCYNVFVIVDGHNVNGDQVTPADIVSKFESSKYRDVESFLVEEFISKGGRKTLPLDYRVHAFGSVIGAIQISDFNTGQWWTFQTDWEPFTFRFSSDDCRHELLERPRHLPQLLDYGREMGRKYGRYIRLDFYDSDRGFVFGEMCATPGSYRSLTAQGDLYLDSLWEQHLPGLR